MDEVVQELRSRGGVASWSELKTSLSRERLAEALDAGRVSRIRRNLYVLADLREVRRLAIAAGGVASHLTAAQHWGWKVKAAPDRPCITLARGSRVPSGDLELHWQDLTPREIAGHVTRRVPTVIACARAYDEATALCVADSALREGQVTREQLLTAARRSPRTGRARAVRVALIADGRAANPFESVLRWLCSRVARVPRKSGRLPSRRHALHRVRPARTRRHQVHVAPGDAPARLRTRRAGRRRS